ncbi:3-dehydroquinate synthase [Candidatus Microgenomates bacterium]|nr:3-dehydroquinate synthase [Candidatus Microgenomates bacterium]
MKIFCKKQTTIGNRWTKNNFIIGSDLLANLSQLEIVNRPEVDKFFILTDKTVFRIYGKKMIVSLRKTRKSVIPFILEPGEKEKNINNVMMIINQFIEQGITRKSILLALGGGVMTDIGGFVASIILRGIDYINLPTTLIGQVDAGLGGKTGVNISHEKHMIKNMIGTFKQPTAVISDINALRTLPEKEIKNGLGEIIKYWIGWGKPEVNLLHLGGVSDMAPLELASIISQCQEIKLDVVRNDPFETRHIRDKLNLGHTVGHAIEGISNGRLSHGEAVALGLVAAVKISVLKGFLKEETAGEIINLIRRVGLPTSVNGLDKEKIQEALKFDKKDRTFVLIREIGKIETNVPVESSIINQVLEEIIL